MLTIWFALVSVFLFYSNILLLTLLVLEIMTFFLIFFLSAFSMVLSDILVLSLFCVFVIEGVIALAGLVILVSYSGSDYLSSSTILKC